jgi:hypothetical protein
MCAHKNGQWKNGNLLLQAFGRGSKSGWQLRRRWRSMSRPSVCPAPTASCATLATPAPPLPSSRISGDGVFQAHGENAFSSGKQKSRMKGQYEIFHRVRGTVPIALQFERIPGEIRARSDFRHNGVPTRRSETGDHTPQQNGWAVLAIPLCSACQMASDVSRPILES